jgi:hypothetical protein
MVSEDYSIWRRRSRPARDISGGSVPRVGLRVSAISSAVLFERSGDVAGTGRQPGNLK